MEAQKQRKFYAYTLLDNCSTTDCVDRFSRMIPFRIDIRKIFNFIIYEFFASLREYVQKKC